MSKFGGPEIPPEQMRRWRRWAIPLAVVAVALMALSMWLVYG